MNQKGFTLLEVVIAFSIITVVVLTVYTLQGSSLFTSSRTRNYIIATNLARSLIARSEAMLEKKDFSLIEPEESNSFPPPFDTFQWKRKVEEVDFSSLSDIISSTAQELSSNSGDDNNADKNKDSYSLIINLFENFMHDSLRKLTITITWKQNENKQSLTFTTFLVRYDADFRTSL